MNRIRALIINIILFFGLETLFMTKEEKDLENKQFLRGEYIQIIQDKENESN